MLRFPLTIHRLPEVVPATAALAFILSALLKLFGPHYLCANIWDPLNAAMIPVEFGMGWFLWSKSRREFGALLGCATMLGAASVLTWAHRTGRDVRTCGCFGPIEMSYGTHLLVTGALFLLCFLTLIARPEPAESPSAPLR